MDVSLVHGWLSSGVQILAALALAVVLARSGRRWWAVWVPLAALAAVVVLATRVAVRCTVRTSPGGHNWQFAARTFEAELPWLTDRLTPPAAGPRSG